MMSGISSAFLQGKPDVHGKLADGLVKARIIPPFLEPKDFSFGTSLHEEVVDPFAEVLGEQVAMNLSAYEVEVDFVVGLGNGDLVLHEAIFLSMCLFSSYGLLPLTCIITPSIMKMQQAFSSYDSVSTTMEICSTVFIE